MNEHIQEQEMTKEDTNFRYFSIQFMFESAAGAQTGRGIRSEKEKEKKREKTAPIRWAQWKTVR